MVDYSETIEVCDIKVGGIYSKLNEYMEICRGWRVGVGWGWGGAGWWGGGLATQLGTDAWTKKKKKKKKDEKGYLFQSWAVRSAVIV